MIIRSYHINRNNFNNDQYITLKGLRSDLYFNDNRKVKSHALIVLYWFASDFCKLLFWL